MISKNGYGIEFYQTLGKLFYAIAAADKHVREEEFIKLKEIIKTDWVPVVDFNGDKLQQIEIVFDTFCKKDNLNANECFRDFVDFKKKHESLYTSTIKYLILKTANAIAYSSSSKNKSELIMLTKLQMYLK